MADPTPLFGREFIGEDGALTMRVLVTQNPVKESTRKRRSNSLDPLMTGLESMAWIMRMPLWMLLYPDADSVAAHLWSHVQPRLDPDRQVSDRGLEAVRRGEIALSAGKGAGRYTQQSWSDVREAPPWLLRMRARDEEHNRPHLPVVLEE